jgi:hypothetical protein
MAAARAAPFTVGEAISFGWDRFKANFGPLAIVTLVVWGVEFFLNRLIRPDTGPGFRASIPMVICSHSARMPSWTRSIVAGERPWPRAKVVTFW